MEKIGNRLRERRLELGLTVEDVSKHTRLTPKHIKAIEEGNMGFFHDDLSYLRFFVKSYCEAVDIDFDDIKDELRDSVNEYTQTLTHNMQVDHEVIEKNVTTSEKLSKIKKNDEKTAKVRKKKTAHSHLKAKELKKIDFSLVSLIAVVGVVAIIIICALVMFIKSGNENKVAKDNEQPIADVQKDNKKEAEEEKKEPEKKTEDDIAVTKNDVTHYTIDNASDGDELNFEITFNGSNSGFSVTVDGQVLKDPAAKVYTYGSTVSAKIIAKKDMRIQFYVGWMNAVSVKLNGKNVKVDDSIVNSNSQATLEFSVTGEE